MNQQFPCWGPNGAPPTHESIETLKHSGWTPNLRVFANREDWAMQAGSAGSPWPLNGPAKFYGAVTPNRAGKQIYAKRNPDGTFPAVQLARDWQRFPLQLHMYSTIVVNMIMQQHIPVPDLEIRTVTPEEAGRFSFDESIDDPAMPPLCEVTGEVLDGTVITSMTHDFPTDCIAYVKDGKLYWATYRDAELQALYPLPVAGTAPAGASEASADQIVQVASIALKGSAQRQAMAAILGSGGSKADQAKALLAVK